MTGIITKLLSGFYYVNSDGEIYTCKARGSFRNSGISPLVGDKVEFSAAADGTGVVDKILPRKNRLIKPAVANIDKLFIISSFSSPGPNSYIIDRLTATAEYCKIEPVIVFNKCDTGDFSEWYRIYKNAGFDTFVVSAKTGAGFDLLSKAAANTVSAFAGNSGVGKSSILNRLFNEQITAVGEISEKLGRGRHTTRHTELYALDNGGFIADTPGFSSMEEMTDVDFKEQLADHFRDIKKYTADCRFNSCSHISESGCAVLEAVRNGKIEKTRHESYVSLFNEMKDLKPWNTKKRK